MSYGCANILPSQSITTFDNIAIGVVIKAAKMYFWHILLIFIAAALSYFVVYQRKLKCKREKELLSAMERKATLPLGTARELSRLERGFKYITDMSVGLIGCCFVLKTKSELRKDFFERLVEVYWNFAPLLRMNIVEGSGRHTGRFFFREMDEIAFDRIIQTRNLNEGETLLNEVEKEICIPFKCEDEPLWRVLVYNMDSDDMEKKEYPYKKGVVIVINHTICDGVAFIELYKQISVILHEYLDMQSQHPDCNAKNDEIPVALEDVVPNIHFPIWFELLGSLGSKILARTKVIPPFQHEFLNVFPAPIWSDSSIVPAPRVLTFKLDAKMTGMLIKTTKQQKCTFTGTLCAAMSLASVKQMQNGNVSKTSTFRAIIPVDLRRYFVDKRYDKCIANYTSISPLVLKCSVRPLKKNESEYDYFWSLARTISKDIHKLVRNSETIKAISVVAPFMDDPSFASDMFKKTTTHSSAGRIGLFSVSNLGIIDGTKSFGSSSYKLEDVSFGDNEVFGGSIFANNVATYDGCLMWNMVYAVHVVSDRTAARVFYSLRETINSMNRLTEC